ncbi:MAG: SPOR domain-containing protein [Paracoccaceae bacterium]|nr:SPOR domain-containing protein [Paracoccaceae bacterium]
MAVMGASGAWAELSINGPADVPPASFTGRQYVDSAGCVFVRAGYGTSVKWVPRVTRDRKQLCGYKPTLAPGAPVLDVAKTAPVAPAPKAVAVAAAPAVMPPAPKPAVTSPFAPTPGVGRPMETIALTTTPPRIGLAAAPARPVVPMPAPVAAPGGAVAAPVVIAGRYVSPYAVDGAAAPLVASPAPVAMAAAPVTIVQVETVAGGVTGCPNLSPVAQRYMLSDGRRVVRCGPQTDDPAGFINRAGLPGLQVAATPMAAPLMVPRAMPVPMAAPVMAAMTPQQAYAASSPYAVPDRVYLRNTASGTTTLAPVIVSTKSPTGAYKPAFEDGRLNPYRGPRDAMGDVMQGQIWTNEVPARQVTVQTPARKLLVPGAMQARVSSKSVAVTKAPAAQAAGTRFVQVGSFGVPSNAEGAKARLRGLGLPVSTGRAGALTVVYAGPLRAAEAPRVLAAARAAGFGDAILR